MFAILCFLVVIHTVNPAHHHSDIDQIYKHYTDHLCPQIHNVDCTKHHDHQETLCASDLVTYLNHCYFAVAHCKNKTLTVRHDGACDVIPGGSHVYTEEELKYYRQQVSGVFFSNKFENCVNIAGFNCTRQRTPHHDKTVCGSDLITYKDHCVFSQMMCKNRSLTLRHEGSCDVIAPTGVDPAFAVIKSVFCQNLASITCGNTVSDSVCGTDGVFYSSQCLFSKTKCFKADLEETKSSYCLQQLP